MIGVWQYLKSKELLNREPFQLFRVCASNGRT